MSASFTLEVLLPKCDIEIYRVFDMQFETKNLLGLFVEDPW